jgi:Holliday junction resolvasome RuvABC endonuclease subunit
MNIVAFDPGTHCLGIATFFLDDNLNINSIQATTFNSLRLLKQWNPDTYKILSEDVHERVHVLKLTISEYFKHKNPDICVIEKMFYSKGSHTAYGALYLSISMITSIVKYNNPYINICFYEPAFIKRSIGSIISSDKQLVTNALKKIPEITLFVDLESYDSHAQDAMAIGYTHILQLRKGFNKNVQIHI